MHRIDGPGATNDNKFTAGNPTTGTPATVVTADWMNSVQEEMANVIEGAGIILNKAANNQLAAAISALIAAATGGGGSSTGEANTGSNVGTGDGSVFKQKLGIDLQFKTIKAGSNITVVNGANEITISAAGGGSGEVNTASNVGSGNGVYVSKVGADLRFKSIVAGSGISIGATGTELTITATGGGGGGGVTDHGALTGLADDDHPHYYNQARGDARYLQIGAAEANTASNLGAGVGQPYASKSGVDLRFRSIKAGTNITVTQDANEITIAAAAGSGEANTASNLGSGEGVWVSKSGVDLRFKSIKAGANASISSTSTEITLNPSVGLGANTFTGVQTATGFAVSSDARLKDDIEYFIADGREIRRDLELYRWRWNDLAGEGLAGKVDSGVLAHEVEEIFPSCVHVGDDGFKRVDYGKLAVHLLLAYRG